MADHRHPLPGPTRVPPTGRAAPQSRRGARLPPRAVGAVHGDHARHGGPPAPAMAHRESTGPGARGHRVGTRPARIGARVARIRAAVPRMVGCPTAVRVPCRPARPRSTGGRPARRAARPGHPVVPATAVRRGPRDVPSAHVDRGPAGLRAPGLRAAGLRPGGPRPHGPRRGRSRTCRNRTRGGGHRDRPGPRRTPEGRAAGPAGRRRTRTPVAVVPRGRPGASSRPDHSGRPGSPSRPGPLGRRPGRAPGIACRRAHHRAAARGRPKRDRGTPVRLPVLHGPPTGRPAARARPGRRVRYAIRLAGRPRRPVRGASRRAPVRVRLPVDHLRRLAGRPRRRAPVRVRRRAVQPR